MLCHAPCAACPADRRATCANQGCHARLAELRLATVAVDHFPGPKFPGRIAHLQPGEVVTFDAPVLDDAEAELKRLDVESGDILVLRTRRKLPTAVVVKWQDELLGLCRAHGVRDVSVLVLDDCTDLTIERPARHDTRMQHQARREPPIVSH